MEALIYGCTHTRGEKRGRRGRGGGNGVFSKDPKPFAQPTGAAASSRILMLAPGERSSRAKCPVKHQHAASPASPPPPKPPIAKAPTHRPLLESGCPRHSSWPQILPIAPHPQAEASRGAPSSPGDTVISRRVWRIACEINTFL